jgi:5S rRNA maturation endonuclease (ribonuclease M5)
MKTELNFYETHVKNLKPAGNGQLMGLCPFHEDRNPSLSINPETGSWYCHGCKDGGGPVQFSERLGVEPPDDGRRDEPVAVYDYSDEGGELLFQVVRFPGKRFCQRRPDGSGGWLWDLKGVCRVLYRLRELQGRKVVYVVEGERDVERLIDLGIPATTNPGGANKWKDDYTEQLRAAGVESLVVLPDNDDEGRKHAKQVARSCLNAGLQVKIVELTDLPPKADISDWLDAGRKKDELFKIVKATPLTTLENLEDYSEGDEKPLVRLVRAAEFAAPPLQWLIEGLLPSGMLSILSGKDTLGKTLFALEVVRSVLTGQPLLDNWAINEQGPVAALFLDDPRPLINERLEGLDIKQHPDLWVSAYDDVDLTDTQAMLAELESEALQRKAKLIVLDSLWHFVPPRANAANDQGLMRPLLQALVRLAGLTGAAVVLVAHDKKSGEDVAGSHVIRAAAKTIVRLMLPSDAKTDPDEIPDTPERVLKQQSNLIQPTTWRLRVEGAGKWSFLGTQREHREGETERAVQEHINSGGEGTTDDIRKAVNKSANDVRNVLKALVERDEIEAVELPTGGRPKTIYKTKAFKPDETFQPDAPVEKSQAQTLDLQGLEKCGGFSTQNPTPRGEDSVEKPLPLLTEAQSEVTEGPPLDPQTWPKG